MCWQNWFCSWCWWFKVLCNKYAKISSPESEFLIWIKIIFFVFRCTHAFIEIYYLILAWVSFIIFGGSNEFDWLKWNYLNFLIRFFRSTLAYIFQRIFPSLFWFKYLRWLTHITLAICCAKCLNSKNWGEIEWIYIIDKHLKRSSLKRWKQAFKTQKKPLHVVLRKFLKNSNVRNNNCYYDSC